MNGLDIKDATARGYCRNCFKFINGAMEKLIAKWYREEELLEFNEFDKRLKESVFSVNWLVLSDEDRKNKINIIMWVIDENKKIDEYEKEIKGIESQTIPKELDLLLADKNLFSNITKKEFDKRIVGEEDTRKVILLCAAGGRLVINSQIASFNLLVNDDAGAGKDYVVGAVLDVLPDEAYIHKTRISPTALTYWNNTEDNPDWSWDGKVFYSEDISNDVLNSDVFKVMCSNGSSATITQKVNGKLKAIEVEIKGKPVVITTTASAIPNSELARRFVIVSLDSTQEQTEQIMKRHSESAKKGKTSEYDKRYKEAMKYLFRVKVKIPYADLIDKYFPSQNIIMRTNYPRFLDFIRASAALHQCLRKFDEDEFIIAEEQDYEIARECFLKVCSNRYMVPLTRTQKRILEFFEKEPELEECASKLHQKINFISLPALQTNLGIMVRYGLFHMKIGEDMYGRDIEKFSLAEAYRTNEKLDLPKFSELTDVKDVKDEMAILNEPEVRNDDEDRATFDRLVDETIEKDHKHKQ